VQVGWTGPGVENDFIGVGLPGERYINYAYLRDGNPVALILPPAPGTYEIRYYLGQDESVLASQVIEVTALSAQLVAPASAVAGTTIPVGWDGPGYGNDFLGIGRPGDGYATYEYVRNGNPLTMTVPDTAGDYEIRYYLGQGESVLVSVPLSVTKP
jgi:Ca-activated chloride channel family protein